MFTIGLFKFIEKANIIVSIIHTKLFNKANNKEAFIKFNLIEYLQRILILVYNIFFKKIKSTSISKNYSSDFVSKSRIKRRFLISKGILEISIKSHKDFNNFLDELDKESMISLMQILNNVKYLYTHSIIDKRKIFSSEIWEKYNQIKKYLNSIKKQIKLPLKNYSIEVFYYDNGLKFLPEKIVNNLKHRDFLDCGAYVGDSAIIFEKFYNPNKIFAFEPDSINYNLMLKTIEMNNSKKIIPIRKGTGDSEKKLKFKSKVSHSRITDKGESTIEIITIDSFVFKEKLSVGLIKMDIEGSELNALNGAKETIKTFKPVLLISIYHSAKQFFTIKKYIKGICSDYKFIIRKLNPITFFQETYLIAWIDK